MRKSLNYYRLWIKGKWSPNWGWIGVIGTQFRLGLGKGSLFTERARLFSVET